MRKTKVFTNYAKRADMVRAMDKLVRTVNDEDLIESWLMVGVADGDINGNETDEDLEYYCEDEEFSHIMGLFLRIMKQAYNDGGLYCNGILSDN